MRVRNRWAALAVLGPLAIALLAGCGSPSLHAREVEVNDRGRTVEHNAAFFDDDGEDVVGMTVITTPFRPSGDVTEIAVQIAHRKGTKLESLEFAFKSKKYWGVYREPQGRWPEDMEFMETADGAVLTIPDLGDIGENTVLYRFLAQTVALSEPVNGMPLRVTFVLDGTRETAEFALKPGPEVVNTAQESAK